MSASIPVAFKQYEVQQNPAAQTRRDAKFDRADKRPFNADELRQYWKLLKTVPGLRGRCLRLHLLNRRAANRISREIRGHVQSHGLTGIQSRHYDGHDYMLEKRQALDVLARELIGGATRPKSAKPRRKADAASPRATR